MGTATSLTPRPIVRGTQAAATGSVLHLPSRIQLETWPGPASELANSPKQALSLPEWKMSEGIRCARGAFPSTQMRNAHTLDLSVQHECFPGTKTHERARLDWERKEIEARQMRGPYAMFEQRDAIRIALQTTFHGFWQGPCNRMLRSKDGTEHVHTTTLFAVVDHGRLVVCSLYPRDSEVVPTTARLEASSCRCRSSNERILPYSFRSTRLSQPSHGR